MDEPIGKYNHIIDCIKSDKVSEYLITDKPYQNVQMTARRQSCSSKQVPQIFRTTTVMMDEKKFNVPTSTNKTNLGFKISGNTGGIGKKLMVPKDNSTLNNNF